MSFWKVVGAVVVANLVIAGGGAALAYGYAQLKK